MMTQTIGDLKQLLLLMVLVAILGVGLVACGGDDETDDGDTPANADCNDEGLCILTGTLTESLTLTADKTWLLRGGVFIGDDENETILTIEPGTTVYGETSTAGMLVVRRNSKIMAEGTAEAPIVFTSSKAAGDRARGDWGGLIINGKAPVNVCYGDEEADAAGPCESFGEGGTGWYGGDDAGDNSGTLKYVRVEFAGRIVSPDNELNGIAFQGVGSGTSIDYVQVHMNKDDGVEFFGGTAQAKHIVVTGVADDCFDWTDGWVGKAQFVVLQQAEDEGDQGIEADNNGEQNGALPRSKPMLSNFTIVGAKDSEKSDIGILLREGTGANIANTIVMGFNEACLDVDNEETFSNAGDGDSWSGELTLVNSIVSCATNFKMDDEEDEDEQAITDLWSVEDWFSDQDGNQEVDPMLNDPANQSSPDFAPASGSPALGAGSAPSNGFFDSVDFIGAIGDSDWTTGWTTHVAN